MKDPETEIEESLENVKKTFSDGIDIMKNDIKSQKPKEPDEKDFASDEERKKANKGTL